MDRLAQILAVSRACCANETLLHTSKQTNAQIQQESLPRDRCLQMSVHHPYHRRRSCCWRVSVARSAHSTALADDVQAEMMQVASDLVKTLPSKRFFDKLSPHLVENRRVALQVPRP